MVPVSYETGQPSLNKVSAHLCSACSDITYHTLGKLLCNSRQILFVSEKKQENVNEGGN